MSRFDFTQAERELMNLAVQLGIVDAVELGCLMAEHGTDVDAIAGEIIEAAFADRHHTEGQERHAAFVTRYDAWRASLATTADAKIAPVTATTTPDGLPDLVALTKGQAKAALGALADPTKSHDGEAMPGCLQVAADYGLEHGAGNHPPALILAAALGAYIEGLDRSMVADFEAHGYDWEPPTHSVDPAGRKYLRIVRTDAAWTVSAGARGQRFVHVFVEVAAFQIWKADGWKGPARNFPRGSILTSLPEDWRALYYLGR